VGVTFGQDAPPFEVVASDGRKLKLEDFRGKKNVVLYFYPKDFTPICTKETCGFRDMYDELTGKDTEVIGVSLDSDESHRKFAEHHKVPFPLVADRNKELAKAYGAYGGLRAVLGNAKRITFVIDKKGKIAAVFESELRAGKHLDGVRETLARLGSQA
jgi:peroxiredoxin Q/BCP